MCKISLKYNNYLLHYSILLLPTKTKSNDMRRLRSDSIEVLQVDISDKSITVKAEMINTGGPGGKPEVFTLKHDEAPHPDLYAAKDKLQKEVCAVIDLTEDQEEKCRLKKVTFNKKSLMYSYDLLYFPHGGGTKITIKVPANNDVVQEDIQPFMTEAGKYFSGEKRAQSAMDF